MLGFDRILADVIIWRAVAFATDGLHRTVVDDARNEGTDLVLSYGRPLRLLVVGLWAFWSGVLVAAAFLPQELRSVAVSAPIGMLLLLVVPLHLEIFRVAIRLGDRGIETRSPWRPRREIPWVSIGGFRFVERRSWYVIETDHHGTIRAHTMLNGIETLLNVLDRRKIPEFGRVALTQNEITPRAAEGGCGASSALEGR